MDNFEEYSRFEHLFLVELLDTYFNLNNFCSDNAFDILNSDNPNKSKDFIDLIYNNTITPLEELMDDEEDNDDFYYVD